MKIHNRDAIAPERVSYRQPVISYLYRLSNKRNRLKKYSSRDSKRSLKDVMTLKIHQALTDHCVVHNDQLFDASICAVPNGGIRQLDLQV
jgi:hypothetical protein